MVGKIEMVKLDSVHSGESPVNGCSGLVSFCLQGRDLATQSLFIGNTPAQEPGDTELDLCHVEPTTVLGSVVKLQAFAYSPSLLGLEGLEGSWFVGVEVVQRHPDLLGRWVSFIGQPPHLLSEVHHGTTFGHCHMPPGGSHSKQVSGAIALVLVIVSLPSAGLVPLTGTGRSGPSTPFLGGHSAASDGQPSIRPAPGLSRYRRLVPYPQTVQRRDAIKAYA